MRYLNGSESVGLMYGKQEEHENVVVGFVDSNYAADVDGRRSLKGYIFKVL